MEAKPNFANPGAPSRSPTALALLFIFCAVDLDRMQQVACCCASSTLDDAADGRYTIMAEIQPKPWTQEHRR
jgi:hypothetical protein